MLGTNGEQSATAQVGEDQTGATVRTSKKGKVQNVSSHAASGDSLWQDNAVTLTRGDVVNEDRSSGGVGHVNENSTVDAVVGHHVLQTGRRAGQTVQIHCFH